MGIVVNIIYSQIRRKTKCKFLLFSMKYIFDLICDDHHNDLCCCLAVPFLFLFFLSAPPAFALNLQLSNWYLELVIFMVMVMLMMVMIVMLITMLMMARVVILILTHFMLYSIIFFNLKQQLGVWERLKECWWKLRFWSLFDAYNDANNFFNHDDDEDDLTPHPVLWPFPLFLLISPMSLKMAMVEDNPPAWSWWWSSQSFSRSATFSWWSHLSLKMMEGKSDDHHYKENSQDGLGKEINHDYFCKDQHCHEM